MLNQIKVIFWDFDGVILESNAVREQGFREVLNSFNEELVNQLIDYHRINGGLSRYVKFRYFFENILKVSYREEEITQMAYDFSKIMRALLTNKTNLITETVNFISTEYQHYEMHVVSGSDQEELRFLCKELNIDIYFKGIFGSPTHKNVLVKNLLFQHKYNPQNCVLIGDSINDYEAAKVNQLYFKGYNNPEVEVLSNIDFSF
jgi:phosphoglycolate phosphatase-like HAD superfamily hydrolase